MPKTNRQKIKEVRSIIRNLSDVSIKEAKGSTFSKKEMEFIVKAITGKDGSSFGFSEVLRKNLPKWRKQATADYVPTSDNLDMIIESLKSSDKKYLEVVPKQEVPVSKNRASISPVNVDWNVIVCKAIESNNVASILIENGAVIIDFK